MLVSSLLATKERARGNVDHAILSFRRAQAFSVLVLNVWSPRIVTGDGRKRNRSHFGLISPHSESRFMGRSEEVGKEVMPARDPKQSGREV